MAAVTSAAIGAAGAAYSISQGIKAGKEKRAAARAIENQKSPELVNAGEGLQVSTQGADLQREEQGRLAATQVQAAQDAGSRGIIGSVGRIAAGNQDVNAKIAANLDEQQKAIDQFKAQDAVNMRGVNEQRFRDKLAALSSQYNASNIGQQQAIGNTIQSTAMIGNSLGSLSGTPKENTIKNNKSYLSSLNKSNNYRDTTLT
jgi:hypothetical protein